MKRFFLPFLFLFIVSCKKNNTDGQYTYKAYVMSVPVEIKVYTSDQKIGRSLSEKIISEIKRISEEFSYNEQYSQTTFVNKNAYDKWVPVEKEFIHLLKISRFYYELSNGGFDPTFAPLWPIWKEAASRRKMPQKGEIEKAISKIGFNYVILDEQNSSVKFLKSLELNFGGILRGYAFYRIIDILKKEHISEKFEIDIGANKLYWGEGECKYEIYSPFDERKKVGVLTFPSGVIISSSGRSHFVEIEGKLYSHILNIKTGYPIENFSNLIVYLPELNEKFISSAALVILGREKAFEIVSREKGACAIWIDGVGSISYFAAEDSKCRWEKTKSFNFFKLTF